jgi:hypothetical protein
MPSAAAPSSTASNSLQVFKPGRHRAMSGVAFAFSDEDVAATAAAYDPAKFRAPLVVGHPTVEAPAYGWVEGLSFSGGALEAKPADVDPAFAQMVNAKRYANISAAFFPPDHEQNPVPGVYYLRHVGFLGATPPAVAGLRTPVFATPENGLVEFADWDDMQNASLWRQLRDWFIGKFGQDEADRVLPGYQISGLEAAAVTAPDDDGGTEVQNINPGFAAPTLKTEVTVTEAERLALEAENTRLKNELKAAQDAQRQARLDALHANHVAFADTLVADAKVAQLHAPAIVEVLDVLGRQAEDAGKAIEFGAPEARAPLAPALQALLTDLPPRVELAEVATKARAADDGTGTGTVEFAVPGAIADPQSLVLHRKVKAYQARHSEASYVVALAAVQAGQA